MCRAWKALPTFHALMMSPLTWWANMALMSLTSAATVESTVGQRIVLLSGRIYGWRGTYTACRAS